jgi:hypothetical protein
MVGVSVLCDDGIDGKCRVEGSRKATRRTALAHPSQSDTMCKADICITCVEAVILQAQPGRNLGGKVGKIQYADSAVFIYSALVSIFRVVLYLSARLKQARWRSKVANGAFHSIARNGSAR